MSPEAEFRIESLEGTHLFLCLVDPSKRAPSESGLGQAVLSMDAVRAAADGSRPWNLDLYSDGVVIGKMRVELEIKNWGEAASDAERRLKEPIRRSVGARPDKAAIVNEIKELMELGKKGPVMATVVPGLADQPLVCTQCKFDNSGKPLALACEMCGGILGVDGGDGGIAIGGGAGADDGCGGSSLAPNGPHPDLEPPPPPPPTTERLISYDAAQAPLVAQPYVAPLAINASQYLRQHRRRQEKAACRQELALVSRHKCQCLPHAWVPPFLLRIYLHLEEAEVQEREQEQREAR